MAKQKRRPRYEFTVHMTHDDCICVSWTNGKENILIARLQEQILLNNVERWKQVNESLKTLYG